MLPALLKNNRFFYGAYLLALVIVGFLQLTQTQEHLMQWVNVRNSPLADTLFPYITNLGDATFFLIVALILLYKNRFAGTTAIASFVLSSLTILVLKQMVFSNHLRPMMVLNHQTFSYHLVKGVQILCYNSFPSGHSSAAFAVFSLLALLDKEKIRGLLYFSIAALVAYSRLYLFEHFPEDIYVGSLIGVTSSLVVFIWLSHAVARDKKKADAQQLEATTTDA